jgi:hypothetical protein
VAAVLTVLIALTPVPVLRDLAWLTGALAVVFGVTYLWRRRFVTRVTSRGIEARGYVNHFVAWDDVAGLQVGGSSAADARPDASQAGQQYVRATMRGTTVVSGAGSSGRQARLATIKVARVSGRRLLLPAPIVTGWASDPGFDDKARQLQELCHRYGHPQGRITSPGCRPAERPR